MLLPVRCAVCGATGSSPCAPCGRALRRSPPAPAPPGVDSLVAVLLYEGGARRLVTALKYRRHRQVVDWLAGHLAALARPAQAVTWVPTTGRRRRARGYDQSELLARALAARLGLPCVRLLRRAPGLPQTGRSRAARAPGPVLGPVRAAVPRTLVLVDDVTTTGASLRVAARVLRAAGAVEVHAAVAARALPRSRPP